MPVRSTRGDRPPVAGLCELPLKAAVALTAAFVLRLPVSGQARHAIVGVIHIPGCSADHFAPAPDGTELRRRRRPSSATSERQQRPPRTADWPVVFASRLAVRRFFRISRLSLDGTGQCHGDSLRRSPLDASRLSWTFDPSRLRARTASRSAAAERALKRRSTCQASKDGRRTRVEAMYRR